jgi:3-hydroxyisobutyrate dehydrogenase
MESIGFIGLGVMGSPMALNMVRAGDRLIVWNRTPEKCRPLARAGATVANSAAGVFAATRIVFLMLANEEAIDAVLTRGSSGFAERVGGHVIVHMGTTSARYSQTLQREIHAAGGAYVECPVSGSRTPAENGELIAMLAGETDAVDQVRPLLAPMCRDAMVCGAVPNALLMKFAVNIFLITTVTGLAEAVHFAEQHGLDLEKFRSIVDAGPMASAVSRTKVEKMVHGDFSVQAAIFDVLKNNRLIAEQAELSNVSSPLLDVCHALFGETLNLGHTHLDMAAVLFALRARQRSH